MKKLTAILLVILLAIMPLATFSAVAEEEVTLVMGSWRNTDAPMVEALLAQYYELTGVNIVFEPTVSAEYNSVLRLQLDSGTGPDLFYSRSYATGEELYDAGFAMDCSDIPGVLDNFTAASLEPWTAADGNIFAVPFAAVSQVIYYNETIFEENGFEVPTTWEDFLVVCQTLQDAGITPLANGIASNWDILECVFLGMVPNYIAFEDRAAYESGEKKMNDETWVEIYTDFAELAQYFPSGFESIDNDNANIYFGMGNAAMLIDGSWSCGPLNDDYEIEVGTWQSPLLKATPLACACILTWVLLATPPPSIPKKLPLSLHGSPLRKAHKSPLITCLLATSPSSTLPLLSLTKLSTTCSL